VIVDQPPSRLIAGQTFGLTAALEDQFGNVADGFMGTVTATMLNNPSGGSLTGPVSTNAVHGIATFSGLALNKAGWDDTVEAASGRLTSIASTPISVAPASPSGLVITSQPPSSVAPRRPIEVGVEAVDAYGNVATGFDGAVTAALAVDPDHNPPRGTVTVQANGGQAFISDATLKKAGKSYAVVITSGGLTPAVTSVFNVIRPSDGGNAAAVRRASRSHLRGAVHAVGQPAAMPHPRGACRPAVRVNGAVHVRP
jgi:hypothetical protein